MEQPLPTFLEMCAFLSDSWTSTRVGCAPVELGIREITNRESRLEISANCVRWTGVVKSRLTRSRNCRRCRENGVNPKRKKAKVERINVNSVAEEELDLLRRRTEIDERRIAIEEKRLEVQQARTNALLDAIKALTHKQQ